MLLEIQMNGLIGLKKLFLKKHIKYYKYQHFSDIQEIGSGTFGKVYRVIWKNSQRYFALRTLSNIDDVTAKAIVHEVIGYIYIYLFILCNY